jgi:MFS transporter, DHA1 family, multidrug resistance protein
VMVVLSQFVDGSPRPMILGIAGCALTAFTLTWLTLRPKKPGAQPAT